MVGENVSPKGDSPTFRISFHKGNNVLHFTRQIPHFFTVRKTTEASMVTACPIMVASAAPHHSQFQNPYTQIIQKDICETSENHSYHGKGSPLHIPDKRNKSRSNKLKQSTESNNMCILHSQFQYVSLCSHQS